jgi:hypothetical protein
MCVSQILACYFIKAHSCISIPTKVSSIKLPLFFMFADYNWVCNLVLSARTKYIWPIIKAFVILEKTHVVLQTRPLHCVFTLCVSCNLPLETTLSTCSIKNACAGLFTVSHRRNNKTLNIGPFCRNMLLSAGHLSALSSVKITCPKWMINSETEAPHPHRNKDKCWEKQIVLER